MIALSNNKSGTTCRYGRQRQQFRDSAACAHTEHEKPAIACLKRISVEAGRNESYFDVVERACAFHTVLLAAVLGVIDGNFR